jgi:pimeloyl-ACP methyl ester carboxylesterase
VVPDQRGYGTSDKPARVRDYVVTELVADALGLVDAFGRDEVDLVCHDWGAMLGWWIAIDHPERLRSFCVMNLPHPRVFARALLTNPVQTARSWYTFAMQIPGIPDWLLRRDHAARLDEAIRANCNHPVLTEQDFAIYRESWLQPGSIPAMLAWYRAMYRHPRLPSSRRVTVPTQVIWGKLDSALGFELVAPSVERCDDVRLTVFDDAAHFVQHDAAERVNDVLLRFLPGPGPGN